MLIISCHADTGFSTHKLRRERGVVQGHLDNFAGVHAVMQAYFSGRMDQDCVRIELTEGEETDFSGAYRVLSTLDPDDTVIVVDVTGTETRQDFTKHLEFTGLVGNRSVHGITTNEFMNALAKIGWREAHNAHILQKLRLRGPLWGISTPDNFARALRNGYAIPARDGAKARVCCNGLCWVIFREAERTLITIRDPGIEKDS